MHYFSTQMAISTLLHVRSSLVDTKDIKFQPSKPYCVWNFLVNLYQVCSNYAPGAKNGPVPGVTKTDIKLTFSEYVHVAYQIKGDEAYNNMLAKVLPLHTSLTPGGSKGHFFVFCK